MDENKKDIPKELDGLDDKQILKKQLYPDQDLNVSYVRPVTDKTPSGIPANLNIDDKEWSLIEKDIGDYIKDIDGSKAELNDKLDDWQHALNQIPTDSDRNDEPFENSCKLCSSISATTANVVYRKISNTVLVEPYYLSKVKGDRDKERLLQDYANNLCAYNIDFETVAKQIILAATTSPYVVINPESVRNVITHHDFKIIEPITDDKGKITKKGSEVFKELYSSYEDAGMSESQYNAKLDRIDEDCTLSGFHEFEFDNEVVEEKSIVNVIPISLYYKFPWDSSVENAKLLGGTINKIYDQLVKSERDGIIKKGMTNRIIKRYVNPEASDSVDVQKVIDNDTSGIAPSSGTRTNYRTKEYKILKGIVRLDSKYVKGKEKDTFIDYDYEFWYSIDEKTLLRIAPYRYNYKKRNYEEAKIGNQCIPAQTHEAYKVITTCLRQYIDGNSMANVPQLTMTDQTFQKLNNSAFDMTHKVGKVWPVGSGEIEPLVITRPDGSQYMTIIQHITQDTESRTGGSRSSTGQNLPEDPQASGRKTIAMNIQSDQQIQDYIQSLRPAFSALMKHLIQQNRQRMKLDKASLRINDIKEGVQTVTVNRDDLSFIDDNTEFVLRNQKVEDSQQSRKQDAMESLQTYSALQVIAERPESLRILIRNAMMRDPGLTVDEIEQILPSDEQIKKEQAEVLMEVQKVQQAQQAKDQMSTMQEDMAQQQDEQSVESIQNMGE